MRKHFLLGNLNDLYVLQLILNLVEPLDEDLLMDLAVFRPLSSISKGLVGVNEVLNFRDAELVIVSQFAELVQKGLQLV
jgi:hypothetical protein